MVSVVKHIVEAHMIHRELTRINDLKTAEAANMEHCRFTYKPLLYVSAPRVVRKIDFMCSIRSFRKICQQSTCIAAIEVFLKNLHIAEVSLGERGITWIELYVLFRLSGNPKPLDPTPQAMSDKAMQAIPLNFQLNHFKNQARRIADRALLGGRDAKLFKPIQVLDDNLTGVGIEGKYPAVGFNVFINEHMQSQVNKSLILLGRHLSQEKLLDVMNNVSNNLTLVPISLRGKTGWDSRLATYQRTLEPTHHVPSTPAHGSHLSEAVNTRKMYIGSAFVACYGTLARCIIAL